MLTTSPQLSRLRRSTFRVDYMGICGLDGRSRAPRDGFMASHIIDTEQLRVTKLTLDGNQEIISSRRRFHVPTNSYLFQHTKGETKMAAKSK